MVGIADLALGAAPIAGGALLGAAAGGIKGPDVRGAIKADLELLEMIPAEKVELRAALDKSIDQRISELIESTDRSRKLREMATSYAGNWRDIVVFVCAVLFAIIWWNVPHGRSNWLVMFIILIVLVIVAAYYAVRGIVGAIRSVLKKN